MKPKQMIIIGAIIGTLVILAVVTVVWILPSIDGFPCKGDRKVAYMGKEYKTTKIGTQCWMATNLDAGKMIKTSEQQSNNEDIEKYCYDDKEENCLEYGGLYTWAEMMNYVSGNQGICPEGWHVPTKNDWSVLINYIEEKYEVKAGDMLKENGFEHWREIDYNFSKGVGFNALPAGYRSYNDGVYYGLTLQGIIWSSSKYENTDDKAYKISLLYEESEAYLDWGFRKGSYSVRCIRDVE